MGAVSIVVIGQSFIRQKNLVIKNNTVTLHVEKGAVYSLTTTSGQQKGTSDIPIINSFPFPYSEDFETIPTGKVRLIYVIREVHSKL